jgi:N utilization substance protein B
MNKSAARYNGRRMGRLTAVQALFQIEQTDSSASSVVSEFMTHRLKNGEIKLSKSTMSFFAKLVEGAWNVHQRSDEMIGGALKAGWTLERIEPVTRAILRAALYELLETQTPPAVIMDEYLFVTHSFFDNTEVSFVNGVLNSISQKIRSSCQTNT